MVFTNFQSNVARLERRRSWRDRRRNSERRNAGRIYQMSYECRNPIPRRESDITGSIAEGEIWWRRE